MEVYVDDMFTKTLEGRDHNKDLQEILGQVRKFNMCLNLEKCAFGI